MKTLLGFRKRRSVGVLTLGLLAFSVSARGQEIRWNPVAASGNVFCTPGTGSCGETEIILSAGGVTVTMFMEVSGWDPGHHGDDTAFWLV